MLIPKQLFTLTCVLVLTFFSLAQRDTLFWFAAPDVSSGVGQSPIKLRFQSYDQAATITVSQPANGVFIPVTLSIPAFAIDSLDLTPFLAQIESPNGNVVGNNGLKIVSSSPINVLYDLLAGSNKELFSLKGGRALGTDFYTPFQKHWDIAATTPASYSGFEIVATQNGTTVLITPRTAITGHAANITFSITLNAGQTYSARDVSSTAVTTLAGSIVSSNKPIAITVFDGQLTQGVCGDAIGDQLIATSSIGTDYAIYRGISGFDRVYVLATQNATAIDVTGSGVASSVLASGETYSFALTDELMFVHSTKPIYVWHVSGYDCELSAAVVPSLNCKGNNQMALSRNSSDSLGVILITRTGFENNFTLNGNAGIITGTQFNLVPGSSGQYKAARIFFNTTEVGVNSTNLIANSSDIFTMAVLQGGASSGAGLAYTTDFYATAYSSAGVDDTVCANVSFPLTAGVGGGAITGSWSSNGFGSFTNGLNSVPNTYVPSPLDTLISPIRLILSTTGYCPVAKDTLFLHVTPAPIVNANVNQSVCSNNATIQLNGSVSGGATSGIWSVNGTGSFIPSASSLNAFYSPSAADITGGTLTFVLTSSNSAACAVMTDTMVVFFTNSPVVNAGVDTITVCANNATVNISGTVTGPTSTGVWTSSGNGIFSPNNSSLIGQYLPSASDTTQGGVVLYLSSTSNGNCSVVKDSVVVIITNAPVVQAGINQIVCSNDAAIQLAGSVTGGTFGGNWTGGAGTYSTNNTDPVAVYIPTQAEINAGSLVLVLTSTNNGICNAVSDAVQFNFVAPPFANFTSTSVCEGEQTTFTDFSLPGIGVITSWLWDFGSGPGSAAQNPNFTFTSVGNNPVQLIVTNSYGCADTASNNAVVFDKPVADFNFALSCPNNQLTVDFADASTSTSTINFWSYDFGGQGSANVADVAHVFASGGSYAVTHIVETIDGCSDTVIQNVVIDPLPNAGFYYNTSGGLNVGAEFNFIDTSNNAVNYLWNFGDGENATTQNPTHIYYQNGNYYVTLYATNNLGCLDSAIQFIAINTVTTEINTLIPTVISPNSDGLNDVWELDFLNLLYPNAHIEIYNEWGQVLFTSDGYQTPWDGTYKGEAVPDGNYFYVIELKADVSPNIYKGVLTVLRKRG